MNILISGGSGFLGSALTDALLSGNHRIYWLSTRAGSVSAPQGVTVLSYDDLTVLDTPIDVIVNLTGSGIADRRWSAKRKRELMSSRLTPTQCIIDYIARTSSKPKLLISGSAIGYYGVQPLSEHRPLDEHSAVVQPDFAHELCDAWERLAMSAQAHTDVAIIRTGVVIDAHGGMMTRLLPAFKMGLGGRLGTGEQMISWISVRDWVAAVLFIMDHHLHHASDGQIYNLTSPNAISNKYLTKTVANMLQRPAFFHLPSILIKLLFGEMATLLIDGQVVYPRRLLDLGFVFTDNDIGFLQEQL